MWKENQHTHIRNERVNRKVILKLLRSRDLITRGLYAMLDHAQFCLVPRTPSSHLPVSRWKSNPRAFGTGQNRSCGDTNTWTLPRASFIGNIREISVDHCYKLKTSLIYTADQSKHILHRHRHYSHLFFRTTTILIYVRFSIILVSTPGFISQRMTEGCVLDRYPITVIDTVYTKHVQSMRLGTDTHWDTHKTRNLKQSA